MSRDRVFPAADDDAGPAGLVDLLLGMHASLAAADALARSLAADADRSAAPDPEAAAFVDVMLGVVALARTFAAVIQAPDPVPTPPPPAPRSREGLLR